MTRANQPPHYEDDERLDWLDGDWDRIDTVREALDAQDLHGIREHLLSVHLDLASPHTTGRCPP